MAVAYFSTKSLRVNDMSRLKSSSSRSHLGCFICMKRNLQLMQLLSLGAWQDPGQAAMQHLRVTQQAQEHPGDTAGDLELAILWNGLLQQREILRAELNMDCPSSFTAACHLTGVLSTDHTAGCRAETSGSRAGPL